MCGFDSGSFCLDKARLMSSNLAAREAEILSATKQLHCRGAIEPILRKKAR
jgi:hypothetical protein